VTTSDYSEALADRLAAYVLDHDHVSFAQLADDFPEFRDGEFTIVQVGPKHSNIVLWTGMTRAATEAYAMAIKSGRVTAAPTSPMTYLLDGRALRLPIAKTSRHYQKPRWLPVILRPGADAKEIAN
jgi:hypothetical protein